MTRPHLLFLAVGFPPAAKSSTYRLREMANQLVAAGWDVTVLTTVDESWERDFGVDLTLLDDVDPAVRVVKLPLFREDLETDVRLMSRERAADPRGWRRRHLARNEDTFPEAAFGGWLPELCAAVDRLHGERPVDLALASCVPYTLLGVLQHLHATAGVPYAVDYRDGWSVDVIGGDEAFEVDSRRGRLERDVLGRATWITFVNDAIGDFYAGRFPELAPRMHVVRNGYDRASVPPVRPQGPLAEDGVHFGHVGVLTFPVEMLAALLEGWRLARSRDPLVARSRLTFRGPTGAGPFQGANDHVEMLRLAAGDGVEYGGPVPKAQMADLYAGWDALVLLVMGGRFMTSGKVYEYAATGLPIVSAHAKDHDAAAVLEGRDLWTGPLGVDVEALAAGFSEAARWAVEADRSTREVAAGHGRGFARDDLMRRAITALTAEVRS
ncbi:MAG: glycosyltransferase [Nocardioidaceae bacterium]|nr:glycosyltransferase [Nocardioidaceae bacterium]